LRGVVAAIALALCMQAQAQSGLPFETLLAVCASCHGEDGSTPQVPGWGRIDGQNREYLVYALKLYRANGRRGMNAGLMMPFAMTLSDREIERLAAHFSNL
jgi:cytochrome c553